MDNPHGFYNPGYNPLFDKATSLQFKYQDITGGKASSHPTTKAVQNELHELIKDITVERTPQSLIKRIDAIQRQLHESQQAIHPLISFDNQNVLHDEFNSFRKEVVDFGNHPTQNT
jgi:hypothetical protein